MKIQEHYKFHGAALTQIVQHPSFTALNKLDGKFGHYQINTNIRVLVKYRSNSESPWQFNFNSSDINTLRSDFKTGDKVFLCLVCGDKTICAIDEEKIKQLFDLASKSQQYIRAEVPKGGSIWLRSSIGAIKGCIPHKDYPDILFNTGIA